MNNKTKATTALFVLDPRGSEHMDSKTEFEELLKQYRAQYGLTLNARRADFFIPANAKGMDLVVFDWGGMALGDSLMSDQIRGLYRWADDHPSALVVMRSALGSKWIDREIENEHMRPLSNVLVDAGQNGWRLAGQNDSLCHRGGDAPRLVAEGTDGANLERTSGNHLGKSPRDVGTPEHVELQARFGRLTVVAARRVLLVITHAPCARTGTEPEVDQLAGTVTRTSAPQDEITRRRPRILGDNPHALHACGNVDQRRPGTGCRPGPGRRLNDERGPMSLTAGRARLQTEGSRGKPGHQATGPDDDHRPLARSPEDRLGRHRGTVVTHYQGHVTHRLAGSQRTRSVYAKAHTNGRHGLRNLRRVDRERDNVLAAGKDDKRNAKDEENKTAHDGILRNRDRSGPDRRLQRARRNSTQAHVARSSGTAGSCMRNNDMCARITQEYDAGAVAQLVGLDLGGSSQQVRSWNGPPGTGYLVVRHGQDDSTGELRRLHWGLIPEWANTDTFAPVNARSETAATKPSFRKAYRRGRGLLPITGWYEWQRARDGKKPYHIRVADSGTLLIAVICEKKRPGGRQGETFAVLTTVPRPEIEHIHDRQPTIIDPDDARAWLADRTTDHRIAELARGHGQRQLEAYAVSSRVNNPRNNGPDLCIPTAGAH